MATFIKLEDSPMFHKQVRSLEQIAEELRDRCQKLYKGSKKYMETLEEAHNADILFAESLEAFGAGQDDPVSVSIGGPIISKFLTAFRELAIYKEVLRSQVEHVLVDRLIHFLSVDLQDAKESRRRFDKAMNNYDQARDKFASLKKSTRDEIVADFEEDLHNSKSSFERSRFNLVNSLMNIEAKKKYEFLESFSAIMDAHLRYFKLGYDLLSQMEPFIHQVLAYAQQSKEQVNVEQDRLAKRIQEFRTREELDHLRVSSNIETSSSAVTMNSHKNIQSIMQTATKGEVQTIKQGYLLKRSTTLRADWKRRFFVLDSFGNLYYYRDKGTKTSGSQSFNNTSSADQGSRVFGRFRAKHQRGSSLNEESLGCRTVNLHTSIIKIDAEDTDLRLCFRIISPAKTYTLQAENEADRIDWMNKISGVIATLLNSHLQKLDSGKNDVDKKNGSSGVSSTLRPLDGIENRQDDVRINHAYSVSNILREIPGNDHCAECNAPEPEWASLNLGILMCIECSGIHRNLGVHISKVRSINLDVKVWEPTVLDLFRVLGNDYSNSIWEELLLQNKGEQGSNATLSISKPTPGDAILQKEKYIQAKYVEKLLLNKESTSSSNGLQATRIWEAVMHNNLREVYKLIVMSDANVINSTYDEVDGANLYHNVDKEDSNTGLHDFQKQNFDLASCLKSSKEPGSCLQGSSLLHMACHTSNSVMLELLLLCGGDINCSDFHGRTPLQYCIARGNNHLAKLLLRRGARTSIKDAGGLSALERAMEMGAITDEELFVLLSESVN